MTLGWRAVLKIRSNPEQLLDVSLQPIVFVTMFVFLFGVVGFMDLPPVLRILMGLVGLMFGYTIPEFWLGGRVRKRQHLILLQIPDCLDLLTISVEAGLGFDAAIIKVTEKLKGPLTEELKRAAAEQRVGKSRQEALRGINDRVEVKELQNLISAIIQADQLGVSMSKVLRIQSEQMRTDRRQRAEEKAARAPILIMLPTVGCIFPSLFIVILAPAALSAMKSCGSV